MSKSNKNRIVIKSIVIFILIVLLIIPTIIINSLIHERKNRQAEAVEEVSGKWALNQTLTGPVLSIPYLELVKDNSGKVYKQTKNLHILPDYLKINGALFPEKRHRGIYEVAVYSSKIQIEGHFSNLKNVLPEVPIEDVLTNKAYLSIGISDMRGIEEKVAIRLKDSIYLFNPGVPCKDIVESGISTPVNISELDSSSNQTLNFKLNIDLKGSEKIEFTPLGKETEVNLSSKWKSPSFDGNFLPDTRNVTDSGFTAYWKVLHLNRNYPQRWTNDAYNVHTANFGLKLMVPTDNYLKSDRAIKYALLFISLTFLIYFFLELLNGIYVHPFQYILIGFALSLFYILLISISEHLNFNVAYIISTVMTISLIYWYSKSVLKENKLALLVGSTLLILYTFIFIIIQMEDFALLIGSLGLFGILTIVMHYSKKIDWRGLGEISKENTESQQST